MVYGVGLVGAGPGAASLHAPTLAYVDDFAVVHVSDGGSGRAVDLASAAGAQSSRGAEDLLADPRVQVVAVCSPPEQHADQIIAAVNSGVRGILCEKPLALTRDDARRAVEACRAAGTALVVGTQHQFDPAWGRAKHHLVAGGLEVRTVAITAALPPNGRYHAMVSEPREAVPVLARPRPDLGDPNVVAGLVRQLVLGLVIHDLPLLRDLVPRVDSVEFARPVPPVGVSVGMRGGDISIQVLASMQPDGAEALWRMSIATDGDVLDVEFPPAFVHAGSARVRVHGIDGRVTSYPIVPEDGYVAEWLALRDALTGAAATEYDEILADALYAIDIADAAAEVAAEGGRP